MITELELGARTQELIIKFYDNGQDRWDAGEVVLSQLTRARQILTGSEIGTFSQVQANLGVNCSIAWVLLHGLDYLGKISFRCNGGGWCYRVKETEITLS